MSLSGSERESVRISRTEEFFHKFYQQVATGIAITDWQGIFQECNPAYCDVVGYSENELRTIDFASLVHPEDREANLVQARRLKLGEIPSFDIENRYVHKNGKAVWVHKFVSVLHDEEGEPTHLIALVTNITERKIAEQALRESEERFRLAAQAGRMYAFSWDVSTDLIERSGESAKILGIDEAAPLTGQQVFGSIHPDDREGVLAVMAGLSPEKPFLQVTCRIVRPDTSVIWVERHCRAYFDEHAKIKRIVGMVVDITESKQVEQALRESEQRLRLATQVARMYAYDWDVTTGLVMRSSEHVKTLGLTEPLHFPHQQFVDRIHSDDRPKFIAAIAGLTPENPTGEVTYRLLASDGSLVWLKSNGRGFFDVEGRMLRVIGMVADVTAQKLAEEALRVSEERRRLAQQAARIATFERDVRTGCITWAEGLDPLYGLPPGSLDGKTPEFIRDLIHPADRQRVAQLIQEALKTGQPTEGEWRVIWRDGSVHWIAGRWQVLMDDCGEPLRVVGVNLDITERKRAEEAINESEQRFRLVADTAPVMIWMSGLDKRPTYFNRPWLDFTGRSETDLQNGLAALVHPDDYQKCHEIYCRGFDQRQPFKKECRLRRHDGQYRWMLDIGVPRFHQDGSFAGYIGSCIDITEQKLAEETLSSISRRLIEAHEQERTWIAREMHDDINQRLSVVAMELDRQAHNLQAPADELRWSMAEVYKQISELSSDIHSMSHRLHSLKLDSLGLAAAAKSFCCELAQRQDVEVKFTSERVPRKLPEAISLCLFRVLQEALQNAVKHSGAKEFRVLLEGSMTEIQLTIRDGGRGFDVEQVRTGSGLGLTSMKERLKLVGGELSFDTQLQRGTTVHARVPLRPRSRAASATTQVSQSI